MFILYIRGMILKFWSWCDISVTCNATCLKIVYIIYSLSIHCSDMFYVTWIEGATENLSQSSHALNALTYQEDCACKDATLLTSAGSAFCFMAAKWTSVSQYVLKFGELSIWFGFLSPWMYGSETVSYNQNLDLLKFWPALTAVTTAV